MRQQYCENYIIVLHDSMRRLYSMGQSADCFRAYRFNIPRRLTVILRTELDVYRPSQNSHTSRCYNTGAIL